MSIKSKVIRLADALKVSIEYDTVSWPEVRMEAPAGYIFNATDTHGVVSAGSRGQSLNDCWSGALSDLENGIRECDMELCEVCNDSD